MLASILLLLLSLQVTVVHTSCPKICQCYSASEGYHVLCQHAGLSQIPSELINHLYSTAHQQIMVDLSWNSLSVLPCDFLQLTSMISLIVTNNRLESIPTCFSQSAIQTFVVKNNTLRFNQTHLLSSRKLLHLDLSENRLPSLPSTFLIHLRRLRTLVLTGQSHLLESNHDHWIRSIPTRNQLSLVLCDEHLSLSLCLFPDLFQEKKLFALELHSHVNCDCSLVYLPAEKLQFRQCSPKHVPLGQCDQHVSRFDQGQSIGQFRKQNYRRICAPEYERCQQLAWNKQYLANTTRFLSTDASRAFSPSQVQLVSLIGNSSVIEPRTTMGTSIAFTVTSKKDNMSAGAIISLSLLLLLVTVVCLYVILSRHYFKMKHHQKFTDYMIKRRKKRPSSNETTQANPNLFEQNINTNSNLPLCFFRQDERRHSHSDDECDLTFYTVCNYPQSSVSSLTEMERSSSVDSSFSSETVIIATGNKSHISS